MSFSRCFLLLAALMLMGLSDGSFAAERPHGTVTKAEKSLRGTWYSADESITFKDNGTIHYKGKRYLYAVSNGGMIQLSGKHSSNTIAYQLAGNKLTLTSDGKATIYYRNRHRRK